MDSTWWHPYWDGQPGQPVRLDQTSTEATWQIPLPERAVVIVIHGSANYLGCAIQRLPIPVR